MTGDPRTDPVGTVRVHDDDRTVVKVSMGDDTGKGQHVWCRMDARLDVRWFHHNEVAGWAIGPAAPQLPDSEAGWERGAILEPNIGGEARVDVSRWPAGVAYVWLDVASYVNHGGSAQVVLQPEEAESVAAALVGAARAAVRQRKAAEVSG